MDLAQSGGGYTFSAGGSYSLGGIVGQADAGALSGGSYTLTSGFWGGACRMASMCRSCERTDPDVITGWAKALPSPPL